ncbi:MAG: class IV adenylate cyclase [Acidobacteriia bacterium]|nr:class IV adenylate cyclase [Terriglobia bacterium]
MAGPKEVEIKFALEDPGAVGRKLRALGFRCETPRTHEMNTLYDLPGEVLRQRGELLRLRKYGDKWRLTHKGPGSPGRHKTRVENETAVEQGERMEAILSALGLAPSFRYEKFRSEWSDGTGHVVVDETPIGNYGEIEGPPPWIDTTAHALGIVPEEYITESYAQLFFDWKKRTGSPAEEMTFAAVNRTPDSAAR